MIRHARNQRRGLPRPMDRRARMWACTWNNPVFQDRGTEEAYFIGHQDAYVERARDALIDIVQRHNNVLGAYGQLERGADGGNLHLQFFIRLKGATGFNTVREMVPHVNIAACNGSFEDNKKYCSKEETRIAGPWNCPDNEDWWPKPGARKDLDRLAGYIQDGLTYIEIFNLEPGMALKYVNHIHKCMGAIDRPRVRQPVRVCLFYGDTGTGKSHLAYTPWVRGEEYDSRMYRVCNPKWMDQYDSQPVLVIDDTDWLGWPIGDVLTMLDQWPLQRERKGSSVWGKWTHIMVLHNDPVAAWNFKGWKPQHGGGATHGQLLALDRRFDTIIRFTGAGWQNVVHSFDRGSWDNLHQVYGPHCPADLSVVDGSDSDDEKEEEEKE